jgi:hypothetical protein
MKTMPSSSDWLAPQSISFSGQLVAVLPKGSQPLFGVAEWSNHFRKDEGGPDQECSTRGAGATSGMKESSNGDLHGSLVERSKKRY